MLSRADCGVQQIARLFSSEEDTSILCHLIILLMDRRKLEKADALVKTAAPYPCGPTPSQFVIGGFNALVMCLYR